MVYAGKAVMDACPMDVVILTPTTQESYRETVLTLPITRLDSSQIARFKAQYEQEIAGRACHVGIDLSRVEFLDSAGLGALVACHKHVRQFGGQVGLIAPRPLVLNLLAMTSLDKILPIYASVDDFTSSVAQIP